MITIDVFIISLIFIIFGLISKKIEKSSITAPMVFTLLGLLLSKDLLNVISLNVDNKNLKTFAELTLILVLFSDSSRIHFSSIKKDHNIPIRLLTIGFILILSFGASVAFIVFPKFDPYSCFLIAAILTPTDAALGHNIFTNTKIPIRIRQALNIESGLNDGLAVPFITIFMTLTAAMEKTGNIAIWGLFIIKQIGVGLFIGLIIGYLGGKSYKYFLKIKWMNTVFSRILTIALAVLAYSLANYFSGSGFIAAFIAGLTIGNTSKEITHPIHDFAAVEGQLFTLLLFFLFGVAIIPPMINNLNIQIILYAILSLTLIRIIPVFLSLINTRLKWQTKLFLGWFGPRGVASIVFALLVLDSTNIFYKQEITNTVIATVFLSIILHGVTTRVGSIWYKNITKTKKLEEHKKVRECPIKYIHN